MNPDQLAEAMTVTVATIIFLVKLLAKFGGGFLCDNRNPGILLFALAPLWFADLHRVYGIAPEKRFTFFARASELNAEFFLGLAL